MKGSFLGEFEEMVLLAVWVLQEGGHANTVKHEVEKHAQRTINLSAIHSALYRMERKGFLLSELGEASKRRGGKRKRNFKVSAEGVKALNEARRIRESFWNIVFEQGLQGGAA